MIKSFRLRNFKAFEDTGDIELKPLTVIAGPNSSGKSSILQSLLLLKQTLDAPPETSLSLDGRFLQYSDFSDLVFGKPPLSACNVGFSFKLETPMPREDAARHFPGLELPYTSEEHIEFSAQIELSFRHRGRRGQGAVVLDAIEVSSCLSGIEGPSLTGKLVKGANIIQKVSMRGEGIELPSRLKGGTIEGIFLRHFTPDILILQARGSRKGNAQFLYLHPIFSNLFRRFNEHELKENLQYLGPLREKPQRIYVHSGNPLAEMGESGQYAAQVLWLEKSRKIDYLPALGVESRTVTLIEAVNDAFQRLGMLQPVDVRTEKSMVYQILFGISGSKTPKVVTIADVGFGVSQLLPILVLGLRADESALLLFEQPEIHLHPKLQANLADFFLTLSEQGKRVVVETHSDHFINRLRRRIAEDTTDSLREKVSILFVQPPQDDLGATIEPLRVDRYGVIENWPPDFLPESADEAAAIFEAALDKRVAR